MSRPPREVLPASVVAVLQRLGEAYRAGRVADETLADALNQLHALPHGAISRADGQIATAAELWPGQRRTGLFGLMAGRHQDTLKQVRRQPDLAWILIFHRDGYVREIALSHLGKPPDSAFMLVALVWRMNDWARPVRIAARYCLERVLPRTPASIIIEAAPSLLIRPMFWGRWQSDEAGVIDGLFQRRDVASVLADHLLTGTSGPLAAMLRQGLKSASLDLALPELARKARDPAVRAVALRVLIEGRASWPEGFEWCWVDKIYGVKGRRMVLGHRELERVGDGAAWIRLGIRDRSAKVRLVAADALTERYEGFADLDQEIAMLNADKRPAVRARGDFLLRKAIERSA